MRHPLIWQQPDIVSVVHYIRRRLIREELLNLTATVRCLQATTLSLRWSEESPKGSAGDSRQRRMRLYPVTRIALRQTRFPPFGKAERAVTFRSSDRRGS